MTLKLLSYLDAAVVTPLLIGFVLFRVTYTRLEDAGRSHLRAEHLCARH